jgi:ATP-binding cassette subfamily F protein 3
MIRVENLSFGFPAKDLYNDVSFTIEMGQHCALIGSNGTGKSTLVDMIIDTEKRLFDGKIIKDESCRIGYASQFSVRDKNQERTVFEFLAERFLKTQEEIALVCEEMATAEDMDAAFAKYQELLDLNEAMDGDNYESNIRKQLYIAGMTDLENTQVAQISGGEYKLLQIMREMLLAPNLLILDEPDVFLDFANLNSLCQLINNYKGTLLVITHNRYLLNHCFNKIIHLENADLQEFDGSYTEYRCSILKEKLKLKLQNVEEQEEIARTQEMVDILRRRATLMVNPVIGSAVNAKQSQLDRLIARQIKPPFIEVKEPEIVLPKVEFEVVMNEEGEVIETEPKTILKIEDYQVAFDKELLENVNFDVKQGEKVAIVGANGTGKTTLISDILKNENPAIHIDPDTKYACLSQLQGENMDEDKTVYEVMLDLGFGNEEKMAAYLDKYCLESDIITQKIGQLSGGEQNMLQIALIANTDAEFLILDEPTSHLDIYAQIALEKAVAEYKGTVLMVSHDFYLVANSADYVLLVEDNTVRRMRTRNFRKMVYTKYFDQKYLEIDKKKQELETSITQAFKKNDYVAVDKLCNQLEEISK